MNFEKSFEELLQDQLTDYENLDNAPDTTRGSMAFIRAACSAAALWGIYQYQHHIRRQAVPINATADGLLYPWAATFGIFPETGETPYETLTRLLDRLRNASAGGNNDDYVRWAKEVDGIETAWLYVDEDAQGLGTVDLVVAGPTGDELVTTEKRAEVYDYIIARRPVGMYLLRILAVQIVEPLVTMVLLSGTANPATVAADITALLNSFAPGQTLYRDQLIGIAAQNGATSVNLIDPAANFVPDQDLKEMIRAGTVDVT